MAGAVAGISMARDEADIVEASVRNMAANVDFLIVADNLSRDGTREILDQLATELPLTVVDDPEIGYWQSQKMSALAARAAAEGAEWVLPWDQDELWYSPFGRIADVLADFPGAVATVEIYDHRATGADDPAEPDPVKRMGWRTVEPLPLHKIACRPVLPVTITQGNHSADYPLIEPLHGHVVLRHFPYRSAEQMIRKARNGAAAYAATNLPESAGEHWRGYGRLSDEQITETFQRWFYSAEPEADETLIYDPAPTPKRRRSA